MIPMNYVYLEPDESLEHSLKLWRYMDVAKLISMLQTASIWLARADTFRDKHEGRIPTEMFGFIEKAYESFPEDDPSPVSNARDFQDYLVKNTYISCWHKNIDENMVMWEIYGRDSSAVAIQTTVGRIVENVDPSGLTGHSLLFKPVIYANSDDVRGVLPYEECFFRKRPHFQYENEVRICLDTYSRYRPQKDTPKGYPLPVFINGLIESIIVHPDSESWFVETIDSVTTKFEVHAPVKRGAYGNM